MNPRYTIIILAVLAVVATGFVLYDKPAEETPPEDVVCTLDAMQCPDGSFVGRTPPNCEFAACPGGNAATTSTTVTVRYTADGFEPKTVTIKRGETVRFVNESERNMWVGSAMHPTHAVYPEKTEDDCLGSSFDQCKAEENGSIFDFTFNYVGTWGYHNHVQANHFGSVVVTEE